MADLVVSNLTKNYGKRRVFGSVSFTLPQGQLLCLAGPSGSGKTTLLRVLCGLLLPDGGEIRCASRLLSTPRASVPPQRRGMALAFQTPALFPHMTVWENLRFAAQKADKGILDNLCKRLSITEIKDSFPQQISGGQAKRAELARALAARPHVLLLDEPTVHLDAEMQYGVTEFIVAYAKDIGASVLYATHNESELAMLNAPVLRLTDGGLAR